MIDAPNAFLYLHTHWDREWYLPFEVYRARLVALVRSVVASLQSGDLPNFLLDGQSSVLEDVIEIDPSLATPISDLMKKGSLSAGPWYVLADQLLVSGESLIRNLQYGLKITEKFGPPAMVGYCPDTFGHSADLPRILNGFDIDNAFVWRGVPKLDGGPVFNWQSPDGSSVLTYHLSKGYYRMDFYNLSAESQIDERLQKWLSKDGWEFCAALNGALIPVGGDHLDPPRNFYDLVKSRVSGDGQTQLLFVSLPDFIERLKSSCSQSLPVVAAELRDNQAAALFERAYMLQGVLSTRLYLKRANRIAEHRITSILEPLFCQLAIEKSFAYPAAELEYAWKLLMQNHPHDSICGCSVDAVHAEMQMRTQKFHQSLDALQAEAARKLVSADADTYVQVALNDMPVIDPAVPINAVRIFHLSAFSQAAPVPVTWACEQDTDVHAVSDEHGEAKLQIDAVEKRTEIFSGTGGEPVVKEVFVHRGWLWPEILPAFGSKTVTWPVKCGEPKRAATSPQKLNDHAVVIEPSKIRNEFLSVEVAADGSLVVKERQSRGGERVFRLGHRITDVADCGDTYNFDPLPDDKPLTARFLDVSEKLSGPLVCSLILRYELDIPQGLVQLQPSPMENGLPLSPGKYRRTSETARHTFALELSLRRGVPLVFFDLRWKNASTDHRLEVLMDTGAAVEETFSENHFSILTRSAVAAQDKLPVATGAEATLDRFPCQRFFIANQQTFFNLGLPEYGTDGNSVGITVLRAVSFMNRPRLQTRGGGAGPSVPTPDANCLGEQHVAYGWAPLKAVSGAANGLTDEHRIQSYKLAELFEGRTCSSLVFADAGPSSKSLLTLDNRAFRLVSCYAEEQKKSVVFRLLNVSTTDQSSLIKVGFAFRSAYLCKLNGRRLESSHLKQDPRCKQDGNQISIQAHQNELITLEIELI